MNSHRKDCYLYGLVDPETLKLRYIGKTVHPQERFQKHIRPCELRGKSRKCNWIKSLISRNLKPKFVIIAKIDYENWKEMEIAVIERAKRFGADLTNSTIGGEGLSGYSYIPSESHRLNLSRALKGRAFSPEHIAKLKAVRAGQRKGNKYALGHMHSEETKKRIGAHSLEMWRRGAFDNRGKK